MEIKYERRGQKGQIIVIKIKKILINSLINWHETNKYFTFEILTAFTYQTTRRQTLEDNNLHGHGHEIFNLT